MQRILITILACLLSVCAVNAGEVRVHGALRAMFHEGQTGTMVVLDTMLPNPDLYAVGALADLSGEITIVGGTTYLSYPEGTDNTRTEVTSRSNAGAALLVAVEVQAWQSITTESAIRFEDIDEAIAELATSAGMNLDERFPFLLEGDFEDLQWHVIDGSRLVEGGTSHQDHLKASTQGSLKRTPATLVGFYSAGDQGIFTHMGSRTHIHSVIKEPLASGHVDHVTIPAGTTVKFPTRETDDASPSCGSIDELNWILGDWASRDAETVTTESWKRVGLKTFVGSGETRSAPDGKIQSRESLRLVEMSGDVFYLAKVEHNDYPVPFKLTSCSKDSVAFENPDHDFPKHLKYQRLNANTLIVEVSGDEGEGFQIRFIRDSALDQL